MTKEQQQAARAQRREKGIPIRCEPSISPTLSNNIPPSLQLPSFDRAGQAGSEGTTMDLCGVSTAPHSVNDAMILGQLELQQQQILELKRQIQEFHTQSTLSNSRQITGQQFGEVFCTGRGCKGTVQASRTSNLEGDVSQWRRAELHAKM